MWADGLMLGTGVAAIGASLWRLVAAAMALVRGRPPRRDRSADAEGDGPAALLRSVLILAAIAALVWVLRKRVSPLYRTPVDVSFDWAVLNVMAAEYLDGRTPVRILFGLCLAAGALALAAVVLARLLHGDPAFPAAR